MSFIKYLKSTAVLAPFLLVPALAISNRSNRDTNESRPTTLPSNTNETPVVLRKLAHCPDDSGSVCISIMRHSLSAPPSERIIAFSRYHAYPAYNSTTAKWDALSNFGNGATFISKVMPNNPLSQVVGSYEFLAFPAPGKTWETVESESDIEIAVTPFTAPCHPNAK